MVPNKGGINLSNITNELWKKLYQICDETETKRSGIDCLVNYYITTLGWSEVKAMIYSIDLFYCLRI